MKQAKKIGPFDRLEQRLEKMEAHLATLSKPDSPALYLTRSEAASMLGISLSKLDQLSNKGILQKHRFGGIVRFRRDEIEKATF